ncbi:MAG: hypothetical protein AAGD06_12380 [Acidobacteriota bacterium]
MATRLTVALVTFVLVTFAVAGAAHAETVVQLGPPGDTAQLRTQAVPLDPNQPSSSRLLGRTEEPSTFFIVPHYAVDRTNSGGDTTLIAIRNENFISSDVTVNYYPTDSLTPIESITRTLGVRETWTANVRDVLSGVSGDFVRGWIRITSTGPVTTDYFQATPSDAFAVGEIPIDILAGEYCEYYKVRFLIGGGFSGGTILTFMLDAPLGGDLNVDPPSITGQVYNESGTQINTFNVWTDDYSLQLNADRLVSSGTNFGSLDIRFANVDNSFTGGAASVTHDASGLFSVGLKGQCLDTVLGP